MRTKLNGFLTLILALVVHISFAQQKSVSGTVTDQAGLPLPGVNIIVEGTTTGTQSDFDGKFTIIASEGQTLLFTYIGQKSNRQTVGSSGTVNVQMEEDAQALDEVVVTALGIKSKPRELSYAVQTVTSDDIQNSNEVNIAASLSSKAAGVQVTSSSGSVGASANIRIRGNTSINRNNSPLFVVDGVPIDNSSSLNNTGGTDNSNRGVDINQNDIASINILKGIAAQTLYGLRAANGVILITTKSGNEGKPRVNVSSNIAFTQANRFPDLQKTYAQGRAVGGVRTWRGPDTFEGFSWGPAVADLEYDGSEYPYDQNGRLVPSGTGNGTPAQTYDNLSFFKTGILTDLNVSVSGGTEKLKYFVSGGKLDQTGISPTEEFGRNSFRSNLKAQLTDKFTLSASGTYVQSGGRRVQRGSNISGIMLGLLRTTPTFDNGNGLSGSAAAANLNSYQLLDGTQRSYRAGVYDNPYWTVAKNPSLDDVNRFIGNLQFDYAVTDWLNIRGVYGFDRFTDSRKIAFDINSASEPNGAVIDRDERNQDISSQLLLIFNKDLNEKVSLGATVGTDLFKNSRLIRRTDGFGLTIPGFFNVSNTSNQTNLETYDQKELKAFLSQVTFGYDNLLFLNGAFRNDWSSTLPEDNNSFQSYSLGGSFVFSELFSGDNNILNYGKLRGSWGRSGNDADTFSTDTYYTAGSAGGDGFITANDFPIFSSVAFERSTLLGNDEIVPETSTEWEVGAEFKFFNSRLSLDVTYYDKETVDQIIQVTQPATTGFTNRVINAGTISNNGWELTANLVPVRTDNFTWDINTNFTSYNNVVEELVEGIEPILLNGFTSTSSRAVAGESYGALFGSKWLRDENGNQLVDDNGLAIVDPENGVIGDPLPDYTVGLRNTFTYKNISLTALLDYRKGGDVWCGTCGILDYFGVSAKTGELREGSYVVDGVRESDGAQNTTSVAYADPAGGLGANRWVRYGFGGVSEDYIFDGTFLKLREVAISYSIPNKLLDRTGISNVSITLAGRNLLTVTDYPGIDPETNLTGDSNGIGLDYFNQPQTETYSMALKVTF